MMQAGTGTILRNGILAGAAGGVAEIVWVSIYAVAAGIDPANIAGGVTTAAGVSALFPVAPAALGIGVHMGLALLLGASLAAAWELLPAGSWVGANPYRVAVPALLAVWALNFFVLLPAIDPAFVHALPYSVSLTSKLLFGVAAAEALRQCARSARLEPGVRGHATAAEAG